MGGGGDSKNALKKIVKNNIYKKQKRDYEQKYLIFFVLTSSTLRPMNLTLHSMQTKVGKATFELAKDPYGWEYILLC